MRYRLSERTVNLVAAILAVVVWLSLGGAFMAQEAATSATTDMAAHWRASAAADREYSATRRKSADALRALAANARAMAQSGTAEERASWTALAEEREADAARIDTEITRLLQGAAEKEERARQLAATTGPEPAAEAETTGETIPVRPEDKVAATEIEGAATAAIPLVRMSAYMKRCKAAGVPLPPKWGTDWQKKGDLPRTRVFASEEPLTEVWTFTDPLGICFALPRKNSSGEIQLLGIICQGTASGKACFWDNVDRSGKTILGIRTRGMDPADIQDGDSLDQNCTDCHRGDNAFFIHPDTILNQAGIAPDSDYVPISTNRAWVNEPRRPTSKFEQCETCHAIPKLTAKYCEVAKDLIGRTMPPDEDWRDNHAEAVTSIAAECNLLAPTLNWDPETDNP